MSNSGGRARPSRLATTGWFFLFLLFIAAISGGIAIGLGYSPRPRPLGWIIFLVGASAATMTVDRWAAVLPAIFGIATLNGLIILISGHALNHPESEVPRLLSALFTMVMAGALFVTAALENRHMTHTDRGACVGILGCFAAMLSCVMTSVANWHVPVLIAFIGCIAILLGRPSVPT